MLRAPLLRLLAVVLMLGMSAAPTINALAQEKYVEGIPDLPLMPGLSALPDSGLVFDKPGGRIVEAFAAGSATPQSIVTFYDETLPQLGWRREAPGAYLREGERLKLEVSQAAGKTTVHFRLFPQ